MMGHRRMLKKHPELHPECAGDIWQVSPPIDDGDPSHSPFLHTAEAPAPPKADEYTGEIPSATPPEAQTGEDVAELLLRQRHGGAVPTTALPPNGPGFAPFRVKGPAEPPGDGGPPFDELPQGDWSFEPPGGGDPSSNKVTVTLPVGIVVVYDWFRAQGWHEGDGSLGTWVNSVCWDWIRHVARKALVVIDREEVLNESA